MAKPHRSDPPASVPVDDAEDVARLSPEEIAFLLGGAPEPMDGLREGRLRAERNVRSNARRTVRRQSDPAFADKLRAADRDRQRRRRAAAGAEAPSAPPPVPLPDIHPGEAARRLEAHLRDADTPQARQLRRRPELVERYIAGFAVYRDLSADGARPTLGSLSRALRERYGLDLTPPQAQKLRDHVEGFAAPGSPWHRGEVDRSVTQRFCGRIGRS